jgi:O-antigen/teichoic acid export membrane protein
MTHSLNKRYFAKLSTNIVIFITSLVIFAIVPRALGPKSYGDYSFLTHFFIQLMPFFTFSTSIAFFTKLSQRQNEFGLISFYSIINVFAVFMIAFIIFFSNLIGVNEFLWPNQMSSYIWMGALCAVFTWIITQLIQISDAYGITISSEIAKIAEKVIGLLIIILLFYFSKLNLINYFLYQYFVWALLIISLVIIINKYGNTFFQSWKLSRVKFVNYIKEFYKYSSPLFVYSILILFVGIFERWVLQKYAGSEEQGYYGFSLQMISVGIIFTSAMSPLIMREFSIAFIDNKILEMKRLFRRYVPMLCSIAAFFSCFISVNSDKIIYIFGGSEYMSAIIPMTIIAFYPIFQTYGQLTSSVFFATGKTKLYGKISIINSLIGIPVVFFILVPEQMNGIGLGATGLSIKFIIFQFIGSNIMLFYISKFLKLNFIKYFAHQIIIIAVLTSTAYISKVMFSYFDVFSDKIIINFLINGFVYTFFVISLLLLFPKIFGIYKKDIQIIYARFRRSI